MPVNTLYILSLSQSTLPKTRIAVKCCIRKIYTNSIQSGQTVDGKLHLQIKKGNVYPEDRQTDKRKRRFLIDSKPLITSVLGRIPGCHQIWVRLTVHFFGDYISKLKRRMIMKKFKVAIPCFVILAVVFGWIGISDSNSATNWPSNSGVLRWSADTGAVVELVVAKILKEHYLVYGTITQDGTIQLVNGNAVISNGEVLMHLTTSGFDSNPEPDRAFGALSTVKLDLSNLNGEANGVFIEAEEDIGQPSPEFRVRYDGPIVLTYLP